MYIVKRDGCHKSVHFDKITARLKKLSYGLSQDHCDPVLVAQKVCVGVYKGITTSQLDELATETAAAMTANHPDYASILPLSPSLSPPILIAHSGKKKGMYGEFSSSLMVHLMVQIVVLQCIIWYTLMLFMFKYRGAKLLITEQFPDTASSIASITVDSDVVSLDGQRDTLETEADIK